MIDKAIFESVRGIIAARLVITVVDKSGNLTSTCLWA